MDDELVQGGKKGDGGGKGKRRIERNMFALQAVGQVYGTCWSASSSDVTSCAGGHPVSLPDSCSTAITKSMLVKKKKGNENGREREGEGGKTRRGGETDEKLSSSGTAIHPLCVPRKPR